MSTYIYLIDVYSDILFDSQNYLSLPSNDGLAANQMIELSESTL